MRHKHFFAEHTVPHGSASTAKKGVIIIEKFYVLDNDKEPAKKYWEYRDFQKKLCDVHREFSVRHCIISPKFHTRTDRLWIIPESDDYEHYRDQWLASEPGKFKVKSKLNQAWIQACKDAGVESVDPPLTLLAFGLHRASTRLFDVGGNIYATYETDDEIITPDGFIELRGSEFYKIMEDNGIEL